MRKIVLKMYQHFLFKEKKTLEIVDQLLQKQKIEVFFICEEF